jgi:hypothetical protein
VASSGDKNLDEVEEKEKEIRPGVAGLFLIVSRRIIIFSYDKIVNG